MKLTLTKAHEITALQGRTLSHLLGLKAQFLEQAALTLGSDDSDNEAVAYAREKWEETKRLLSMSESDPAMMNREQGRVLACPKCGEPLNIGQLIGRIKSRRKAASSRANGKLGGRPKKAALTEL